jgi:hypothetical protein
MPASVTFLKSAEASADRLSIDGGKSWVAFEKLSAENSAPVTIGNSQSRGGSVGQKTIEVVLPQDGSTTTLFAAIQRNPDVPNLLVYEHGSEYTFKNAVFTKSTDSRTATGVATTRTLTFVYQTVTDTRSPGGETPAPSPSASPSCKNDGSGIAQPGCGHDGSGSGGAPVSGHGGTPPQPPTQPPSPIR